MCNARVIRVRAFKRRLKSVAAINEQRLQDIAHTRIFLGSYGYDNSLTMPLYHHDASRQLLIVILSHVERMGGNCDKQLQRTQEFEPTCS